MLGPLTREALAAYQSAQGLYATATIDQPTLESQLLGLVWRGGKIDHANGEHDDWANAAVGALVLAAGKNQGFAIVASVPRYIPPGTAQFLKRREDAAGWERFTRDKQPRIYDPRYS